MEQRKKNAKLELGFGENLMSLARIVLGFSYLDIAKFIALGIYASHNDNYEMQTAIFSTMSDQRLVTEASAAFFGATFLGPYLYAFGSDFKRDRYWKT